MKILVVEDEYHLGDAIRENLERDGYNVSLICNDKVGYLEAVNNSYDLIILDIMLPEMDGFTILKKLREASVTSKIIILTAKSTLYDKLEGLLNGTNYYITKPFHVEELKARIRILLNGTGKENKDILIFHDLQLSVLDKTLTCTKNNKSVSLVNKEYNLLEYFFLNQNQVLSKEQIYDRVWGINNESASNNLEVYLSFVRRKIKSLGSNVKVKSLRNLGYKLEVSDE